MANLGNNQNYKQDHLQRIYPFNIGLVPYLYYRCSIRKHQIFVRRELFSGLPHRPPPGTVPPIDRSWQTSATYVPQNQPDPQNLRIRSWNGIDVNYYSQQLINEYNKNKAHPLYIPFKVIVPSLCHIGFWNTDNFSPDQIKDFMRTEARQQVGCHLFVRRRGDIATISTYVVTQNENYGTRNVASISSIYPVMRYEWRRHPKGNMTTVLGLHFKRFIDYREGDRYYHRYNDKCLRAGGVYEMTEQRVNSLIRENNRPYLPTVYREHGQQEEEQTYFGLFVCAGAKLVVMDGCQEGLNNIEHHNRSFIQQGGMVFVDGTLTLSEPKFDDPAQIDDYLKYTYGWHTFIDGLVSLNPYGFLNTNNQEIIKKRAELMTYNNPILFLGANDSQFNSIAWHLYVDTFQNPYKRRAILGLPQGGRIVSIANGREGLEEVIDRIYYENLHDSVVTKHGFYFKAWAKVVGATEEEKRNRLKRILNLDEMRSYEYDFQHINSFIQMAQPQSPMYREFNIMRPDHHEETIDFYYNSQRPPPVPPMYPPLYDSYTNNLIYLPNNYIKEMQGYACNLRFGQLAKRVQGLYPKCTDWPNFTVDDPYEYMYSYRQVPYILTEGRILKGYHWNRSSKNINQKITKYDGINHRLGVDGWVWTKQLGGQQIGTFSRASVFCIETDQNAMDPNEVLG